MILFPIIKFARFNPNSQFHYPWRYIRLYLLYPRLIQFNTEMLGDNLGKSTNLNEKNSFLSEFQDTKINQLIKQKDQEIKQLKKTVKKLQKELKLKAVAQQNPKLAQNSTQYFTVMMERELKRFNELKDVVIDVTERMRKLSISIDSEYSLTQSTSSLQNMVNMLNIQSNQSNMNSQMRGSSVDEKQKQEFLQLSRAYEGLQVMMKTFQMKFNELNKERKNLLTEFNKSRNQHSDEVNSLQNELKSQRKKKEQIQILLQLNQKQKNQLVNSINCIIAKNEIADLQKKEKEQIIKYAKKLNYRIKDLQAEKQQYLKLNSKDKETQMKLYQNLLSQVKDIKQKSRLGKSISLM